MTIRENLFLRPSGRHWWRPLAARAERRRSAQLLEDFTVDPLEPEREITTLSGGNQQKVVVAKWCETKPRLLVLNEPTAGVDLGAKAEIHSHIKRMCDTQGCGVLLISTDFNEVAELADRVYVMYHRHLFQEIDGTATTGHRLVTLAYGRNDDD
jgi:ribose transport system ATP-binding protein